VEGGEKKVVEYGLIKYIVCMYEKVIMKLIFENCMKKLGIVAHGYNPSYWEDGN
jgi:hypothetical protein